MNHAACVRMQQPLQVVWHKRSRSFLTYLGFRDACNAHTCKSQHRIEIVHAAAYSLYCMLLLDPLLPCPLCNIAVGCCVSVPGKLAHPIDCNIMA